MNALITLLLEIKNILLEIRDKLPKDKSNKKILTLNTFPHDMIVESNSDYRISANSQDRGVVVGDTYYTYAEFLALGYRYTPTGYYSDLRFIHDDYYVP